MMNHILAIMSKIYFGLNIKCVSDDVLVYDLKHQILNTLRLIISSSVICCERIDSGKTMLLTMKDINSKYIFNYDDLIESPLTFQLMVFILYYQNYLNLKILMALYHITFMIK